MRKQLASIVFTFLLIEFFDEFVFGVREAAWPLIRNDFDLSYTQIGLLLGIPSLVSAVIEPVIGVLGDAGWRRRAILLGGVVFATQMVVITVAPSYAVLLLAFCLIYPASGAFVSLSQASLMDTDPSRAEHLMARWTFAGSIGVVAGPIALAAMLWLGLEWRAMFLVLAALGGVLTLVASRRLPRLRAKAEAGAVRDSVRATGEALRRASVWRWLLLLAFGNLVLDVLLGFMAMYFVDEVGVSAGRGGFAIVVWSVVGLVGDGLLIPLLTRVRGVRYLRLSAALMLLAFPAFLLMPGFGPKLVMLGVIGLLNAGWYAILIAGLYTELPGRSGTVMAVSAVGGTIPEVAFPAILGILADQFGLDVALWFMLLGPIALLVGLPRADPAGLETAIEEVN